LVRLERGFFRGEGPSLLVQPAAQTLSAMFTTAKSAETWQTLMELRCRREVLERWLASQTLPNDLEQGLQAMLCEVEDQIQTLTNGRG